MNPDYKQIEDILLQVKSKYIEQSSNEMYNPNVAVTERDIVSELYSRLKDFCNGKKLYSHTEIKAAPDRNTPLDVLKKLKRIDNVILKNIGEQNWMEDAIYIQNRYQKGSIESRFSSIPIKFFHTAIEVKIQSYFPDLKKDIDKLSEIKIQNKECNCIFFLLNARGKEQDHKALLEYAKLKDIPVIEFSANLAHDTSRVNYSIEQKKFKNTVLQTKSSSKKPRRQRIIELILKNCTDTQILQLLDKEYPKGMFKTSNKQALNGVKHDPRIQWHK